MGRANSIPFRGGRSRVRHSMNETEKGRGFGAAVASMLLALFFWATVPLLLEHFTHLLDPWTANGARYFFSAAFWLPFVARATGRMCADERRMAWRAALAPAAAHCAAQVFFGMAPYHNNATVLNFGCRLSIPFATMFGFWMLADERRLAKSATFWCGLACAGGGFGLMFQNGFGTDSTSAAGMGLLAGFSAFWGLYAVLVRRNLSGQPAHMAYGMVSLLTFPPLLLLALRFGDWRALAALTAAQWGWLALSSLMGLTLGHVFYYRAIRVLGPIATEGSMLLIPFQTAALAYAALGERLRPGQWAAGGALMLGCAALLLARYRVRGAGSMKDDVKRPQNRESWGGRIMHWTRKKV